METEHTYSEDLSRLIRHYWRVVTATSLLGIVAATVVVVLMPKEYRAEMTLSTIDGDSSENGLRSTIARFAPIAGIAGLDVGGNTSRAEAVAMLKSRRIARTFLIKNRDVRWILYGHSVRQSAQQPSEAEIAKAVKKFLKKILDVREDHRTGLIIVSVTLPDRERAALIANDLVRYCDEELRGIAIAEATKSEQLIASEILKTTMVELKQAMYVVYERTLQRGLMARVRHEYYFRVIDPAVAPQPDDSVSPVVPLVLLSGLGIGFILGVLIAKCRAFSSERTAPRKLSLRRRLESNVEAELESPE